MQRCRFTEADVSMASAWKRSVMERARMDSPLKRWGAKPRIGRDGKGIMEGRAPRGTGAVHKQATHSRDGHCQSIHCSLTQHTHRKSGHGKNSRLSSVKRGSREGGRGKSGRDSKLHAMPVMSPWPCNGRTHSTWRAERKEEEENVGRADGRLPPPEARTR